MHSVEKKQRMKTANLQGHSIDSAIKHVLHLTSGLNTHNEHNFTPLRDAID